MSVTVLFGSPLLETFYKKSPGRELAGLKRVTTHNIMGEM
jgi:hypothetical protein